MSESTPRTMTYDDLREIISGPAAAIRVRTRLQPAGGEGDKVFPPTYVGGVYACEDRRIDGRVVKTVLLDSVQSQANRFELALLDASRDGKLRFPIIAVDFSDSIPGIGQMTSLEVPHRSADALIRDSLLLGKPFPDTEMAREIMDANVRMATALLEFCPTALVFGTWDSTGARGGLGNKFARCIASEIVAFEAEIGVRTSSRIDPTGIEDLPLYQRSEITPSSGDFTPYKEKAATRELPKEPGKTEPIPFGKKPSEINLGNVTPDRVRSKDEVRTKNKKEIIVRQDQELHGGVTMSYALQMTVLSLPALRRLRFPDDSGATSVPRDTAAQLTLAALALAAIAFQRCRGYDLRSRCALIPEVEPTLEVMTTAKDFKPFTLSANESAVILASAVKDAKRAGLPWREEPVILKPKQALVELIKKSREG